MAGQKCDGGSRTRIMRRPKIADVEVSYQHYQADVVERPMPPPRRIRTTEDIPKRPPRLSQPSKYIGIGLIIMCFLLVGGVVWGIPFVTDKVNHWNYGEARLSYFHLNVGHNGPSDFLAEYLHGQAVVIEFPGGKTTNTHVYSVSFASATDKTPRIVTLVVQPVNPGGKAGKPDLLVEVEGFSTAIPLYNTGEAFQAGGVQ